MKNNNNLGKCILVCAGDFTLMDISPDENDLVIAVDAGLGYCRMLELVPDLIIGDFDSADEKDLEIVEKYRKTDPESVITLPHVKDDTDTIAAVKYALKLGYKSFRLYGAMGGRMDHYLSNIQTLLFIKHNGGEGFLVDGSGMVLVAENERIDFKSGLCGIISVFPLGEKAENVHIGGMLYNAEGITLNNDFPLGESNEFTGEASYISVGKGTVVVIITWQEVNHEISQG